MHLIDNMYMCKGIVSELRHDKMYTEEFGLHVARMVKWWRRFVLYIDTRQKLTSTRHPDIGKAHKICTTYRHERRHMYTLAGSLGPPCKNLIEVTVGSTVLNATTVRRRTQFGVVSQP